MEEKFDELTCPHCGWVVDAAPESLLHLKPGTVLQDKYLIGRALGQGGFGITYLALDTTLNIKLAIKEYMPQQLATRTAGQSNITVIKSSQSEEFEYGLAKFLEEARTIARFNDHPNIVSVRDFFETNSTAYLVMSFYEGVTLQSYLNSKGGKIQTEQALNIFMAVLDALKEVHAAGILHRDISPDNLLIDTVGRVVIIDFGSARQAMGEQSKSLSVIMKAGYSPEEQYRSQGKQGPWTDIYAVAATMYRAITGQMPPESLDRLAEDTLINPSKLGASINHQQEQAIIKALAVRKEGRYQEIEDFQQDLVDVHFASVNRFGKNCPAEIEKTDALNISKEDIKHQETSCSKEYGNTVGNIINGGLATRKEEWVYFNHKPINGYVLKSMIDAHRVEIFIKKQAAYLNIVGNWLYYASPKEGSSLNKAALDGSEQICISRERVGYLNVVDSWIYYINFDQGNRIYEIQTDGKCRCRINNDISSYLNVIDDWLFYVNISDNSRIYKISKNGTGRTRINGVSSGFINVIGDWIYYCNESSGNSIYKIRQDGSNNTQLCIDNARCLNVVNDWIYYSNISAGNRIYKIRTDGSDRMKVNDDNSYWLNVVGNWIYYRNRGDNYKVYKIRSDGSEKQPIEGV